MDKYRALPNLKKGALLEIGKGNLRFCLAPDMGGRVFALVCGLTMHRIDLENTANPNQPFNNFGDADIRESQLTGSRLTSLTSFAVFKERKELKNLVNKIMG